MNVCGKFNLGFDAYFTKTQCPFQNHKQVTDVVQALALGHTRDCHFKSLLRQLQSPGGWDPFFVRTAVRPSRVKI